MDDAERIWREKSDEDLLDAAAELDQFTEAGQRVIRAELRRRGLEDPLEQAGDEDGGAPDEEEAPLQCLRCSAVLRLVDMEAESRRLDWQGGRFPLYDPTGLLHVYACPDCGHVELFVDLPGEPDGSEPE